MGEIKDVVMVKQQLWRLGKDKSNLVFGRGSFDY